MQIEAKLTFEYESEDIARNVAQLIQVDNEIAPKTLKIRTTADKTTVTTELTSEKAATFFATMDDLIFSEKLIAELLDLSNGL